MISYIIWNFPVVSKIESVVFLSVGLIDVDILVTAWYVASYGNWYPYMLNKGYIFNWIWAFIEIEFDLALKLNSTTNRPFFIYVTYNL